MAVSVPTSRSYGRSERRIPQKLAAELSHPDESLPRERAFTQNLSPHGARVTTGRPWQPGSRVLISFPESDVLAQGRIVYCQRVEGGEFCIGLELPGQAQRWWKFR
jgi:PilZ domain-containing protein